MKKRNLFIGGLLVLGVTATACGLAACVSGEPPKEEVPNITETVRYTEKTNPYAELTWQEYQSVDDWADKLVNAPVYYQFDGSYSEAWQGNYSRDYIYINCYEDGSLHAELREDGNIKDLYGYWTNITNRGRESLVMHVVSYGGHEYRGSEIVCDSESGYYEYKSNIIIEKNQGRSIPISGLHYSPVESLSITTSDISKGCIVGDQLSYSGLVVTLNRKNGKSIAIDSQSYTDPLCRVKFSGFDSSEAGDSEVTVSYVYSDITAKYTVKVMGVKAIDVDDSEATKEFKVGDRFVTDGLVVKATRDDNVVVDLDLGKCEINAPEGWGTPGNKTVTVKYGNFEKTYTVTMGVAVYNGNINGKEATLKLNDLENCEFIYDGTTYTGLTYSIMKDKYGENVSDNLYAFAKSDTSNISEELLKSIKNLVIDKADSTISSIKIYKIPDNGNAQPGDERYENEIYDPGGGSEVRYLIVDEVAGTATISYKYWYHGTKDTFVCKYTIDENGVLTLTEEISSQLGYGGSSFEKIHKVWQLHDDGTATRNPLRT